MPDIVIIIVHFTLIAEEEAAEQVRVSLALPAKRGGRVQQN